LLNLFRFCREGLTSRPAASSSSREISLQIDPENADLDDHILGLRGKLSKLKGVSELMNLCNSYEQTITGEIVHVIIFRFKCVVW
jgi:protein transporter SFT1